MFNVWFYPSVFNMLNITFSNKIEKFGGVTFFFSTVLELFTAFASEVSATFHPFKVMNNTMSAYILQIVTSGNTYSLWKISAAGCASGLI